MYSEKLKEMRRTAERVKFPWIRWTLIWRVILVYCERKWSPSAWIWLVNFGLLLKTIKQSSVDLTSYLGFQDDEAEQHGFDKVFWFTWMDKLELVFGIEVSRSRNWRLCWIAIYNKTKVKLCWLPRAKKSSITQKSRVISSGFVEWTNTNMKSARLPACHEFSGGCFHFLLMVWDLIEKKKCLRTLNSTSKCFLAEKS